MPAGMITRVPRRLASTGDSGDMPAMAKAKGKARRPAESGL